MRARRDNQKLGQATLADFHKVKVIFVGEDANNTSRRTSLLGGFTVVDIALEMWIILDHSRKSRSRSANRQRLWRFPNISDECSRSSRRHTGTGKPKKRSRRFDLFCEGQGNIYQLPCKSIPSCMTVQYNVAVAAIVSEILPSGNFHLNVCQRHKSRPRLSKVTRVQRLH